MLKEFCERALHDLSNYKCSDREELFLITINHRLEKSMISYQEDLDQCINYLKRRNELNVLRKMNKMK